MHYRAEKKIPKQAISFFGTSALIFLPWFILRPAWLVEWLSAPRPAFARAISAAIPRLLLHLTQEATILYWAIWLALSAMIVFVTLKLITRSYSSTHSLDILVLVYFLISPLVHDYDLIQVLPTIWGPLLPPASIILSMPGWYTITSQYASDGAWATFSLIVPGLLIIYLLQLRIYPQQSSGQSNDSRARPPRPGS